MSSTWLPCTQHRNYHRRKDMGAAILKLVAVITRDFNIMDEEVPEAVVDESDELAHINIIMDVKRCVRNSRNLDTRSLSDTYAISKKQETRPKEAKGKSEAELCALASGIIPLLRFVSCRWEIDDGGGAVHYTMPWEPVIRCRAISQAGLPKVLENAAQFVRQPSGRKLRARGNQTPLLMESM